MKISNSKKQLAKIILENGGWRDGFVYAAQDKYDKGVDFYARRPRREAEDNFWHLPDRGHHEGKLQAGELVTNWHQTILSRDEYFHLYPVAEPVKVVVENKTTCHLTVTDKPTIEQLAADYRNRKDYAERKQQEADAAKADAEAKLAELVAAGKAIGLVLSVVGAAPEPELVVTDWRDLREGDEIRCTEGTWASCFIGRIGVVEGVADPSYQGDMPLRVEVDGESDWGNNFDFIRRPTQGGADA